MTCTVHHIRGDQQTGKTTMALGFLERLERTGRLSGRYVARGLYIALSQDNARHWQRTTPIQCVGLSGLSIGDLAGRSAIVVDDCGFMDRHQYVERLVWAWNHLNTLDGPTQLVLVNWPGDFPPKETP